MRPPAERAMGGLPRFGLGVRPEWNSHHTSRGRQTTLGAIVRFVPNHP
jgi:hypothetical protein